MNSSSLRMCSSEAIRLPFDMLRSSRTSSVSAASRAAKDGTNVLVGDNAGVVHEESADDGVMLAEEGTMGCQDLECERVPFRAFVADVEGAEVIGGSCCGIPVMELGCPVVEGESPAVDSTVPGRLEEKCSTIDVDVVVVVGKAEALRETEAALTETEAEGPASFLKLRLGRTGSCSSSSSSSSELARMIPPDSSRMIRSLRSP
mmetsp:Transcript_10390/g.16964  ORF Transcript_10390/g.16964 Transcript_10390/m.16964 type:complete len:204 (-) Transcript_10390:1708-2319(-)